MKRYHNSESGIEAFDSSDDCVRVWFKDGSVYEYRSPPVARQHIVAMKQKAVVGDDLNTYINTNREEVRNLGKKLEAKVAPLQAPTHGAQPDGGLQSRI